MMDVDKREKGKLRLFEFEKEVPEGRKESKGELGQARRAERPTHATAGENYKTLLNLGEGHLLHSSSLSPKKKQEEGEKELKK